MALRLAVAFHADSTAFNAWPQIGVDSPTAGELEHAFTAQWLNASSFQTDLGLFCKLIDYNGRTLPLTSTGASLWVHHGLTDQDSTDPYAFVSARRVADPSKLIHLVRVACGNSTTSSARTRRAPTSGTSATATTTRSATSRFDWLLVARNQLV